MPSETAFAQLQNDFKSALNKIAALEQKVATLMGRGIISSPQQIFSGSMGSSLACNLDLIPTVKGDKGEKGDAGEDGSDSVVPGPKGDPGEDGEDAVLPPTTTINYMDCSGECQSLTVYYLPA